MQDIMEKVTKYTGLLKLSSAEVVTPMNIVKDMVDLLPAEIFRPESTFLDPAVKSGRFLLELFNRLMESPAMIEAFPDTEDRKKKILTEQLFGLATSETTAAIVRKALYDDPNETGNIIYSTNKFSKELIQGAFHVMQFDVVIGNPPYNKDIYLDFVTQGFAMSKDYSVMITPAKWQAKGGKKNEDFREKIVPHMSKIVYYPDCLDVFAISDYGGIAYYIIDKGLHDTCIVENSSVLQPKINSTSIRTIQNQETLWNWGQEIIDKISGDIYIFREVKTRKRYTININNQVNEYRVSNGVWDWDNSCIKPDSAGGGGVLFSKSGDTTVTGRVNGVTLSKDDSSRTSTDIFTSDDKDEAINFYSWVQTKFIRFLILVGIGGISIMNPQVWRFVPDPGPFDHIFTDTELYKKYNLTPEEINIIESVIKERK